MTETRQHPRFSVRLTVDCSTREAFVAHCVTNLSRGGLFIASEVPLPIRSEIDLILTLAAPDDKIRARGRVIWNYDIRRGTSRVRPGMGIKFLDMSASDSRRLADYLAALDPKTSASRRSGTPERVVPPLGGERDQ